jgi:hypothetical protein
MATSVNLGYCPWLAGSTFTDAIGRADIDATTYGTQTMGGVLATGTGDLEVVSYSGMSIQVLVGTAVVPNAAGSGQYRVFNPTTATLVVPTAPSSPNSRIDLICATVVDNGNSTSYCEVQLVEGTASSSPAAPATPSDSVALAQVAVGSGVTTILQSNITDERVWTALAGGVIVCPNMSSLPTGDAGTVGYDVVNNRYFMLTAAGAKPFKVMGWTPTQVVGSSAATLTGVVGSSGSLVTVTFGATSMSASITTDGTTDIEITIHWLGLSMVTPTPTEVQFAIYIDSTQLDMIETSAGMVSGITWAYNGGTSIYTTSAAAGDTPSAGNHTITWKALAFQQTPTSENVSVVANSGHLAYLRVQPVTL